jgi:outer membrane murein-binding lipoprotein Lpp
MKNNLVLVAVLSAITTLGGGVIYHLDKQNKLAEEAAAQQMKERRMLQMDIEANKQDLQKTRNILLNRYPTNQNPTPEEKERKESARKLNETFSKSYNEGMGRSAKPTSTPTPNK